MDKQAVLTALKSYAEEHLILDHKENYELKDHRWHAKDLLVKGVDGRNDMVDGLFDRSELGKGAIVNLPLAAHLPHLPQFGLRLDATGTEADHGYRLEVDDPEKLRSVLFHGAAPDPDWSTASHQLGHLLGTLEGADINAARKMTPGYSVPQEVYDAVGQAAIKGNSDEFPADGATNHATGEGFAARQQAIKTGMGMGLSSQGHISPSALVGTHSADEIRAKVRAIDEDDWRWHNQYVPTAPLDPDEYGDFLDEKTHLGAGHFKTESDVDEALVMLKDYGADEGKANDWADDLKAKLNSGPTSVGEVDDWLDNEHGHRAYSVEDTIEGHRLLDDAGTHPDVISEWVASKLNKNTSEDGAVSDHSYDDRPFDPQKAVGTVKAYLHDGLSQEHELLAGEHETAYHEAVRHVAQWPDPEEYRKFRLGQMANSTSPETWATFPDLPQQVQDLYMTQDAEHRARAAGPNELPEPEINPNAPVAQTLSTPEGQRAFFRTLDDSDMYGFDGEGHGWDSDTTVHLGKAQKDWDNLPPEDRARRYADAARFIDRSAETPLMVFSDDAHKAQDWLADGAYKYTRYTTVPRGDGHTRTEREDEMGIGRVNYAAHGFDAPLPPILGDGRGSSFFPVDDIHGECADFRTMGYGNARFMFDYPSTPVSHAVSDTYMDARFCPDGGWRSLLANAPAFAETQGNYAKLANPTQGSNTLAESGHEIPAFVELHPKDLPVSGLRSVQLREFRASPDALSLTNEAMLQNVLTYSDASVMITPTGAKFYPPDYEHRREHPGAGTMYNYELVTGPYNNVLPWSEQEARDQIDKAQEYLDQKYKVHGDGRVRLYVPKWARR